ncbi:hypothetical protein H0H87_009291 [Tephrocybe sp. NHM501043]|nr:hypothetical protein H0H87_009291 [Tephrocybe sp. NHM501043]
MSIRIPCLVCNLTCYHLASIAPAAGVKSIEGLLEYIKDRVGYTNDIIGTALAPREDGGALTPTSKSTEQSVDASVIERLPLQPSAHKQRSTR